MPADSIKTEGQDYIRVTTPAPGPVVLTNYIHGEYFHQLTAGPPGEAIITEFIHGEFFHQFEARERNTWTGAQLERNNIDETITSAWAEI